MTKKSKISELIKACRKFDRKAQKELYLLFADDLMSVAIRYAKDQPAAKDIVHDTFLKVFNSLEKFDEKKGTLYSWMCRILINIALMDFRKHKRMTGLTTEKFEEEPFEGFSIIHKLQAEDILNLVNKLPERCRLIFNLHVVEGYKHTEIGDLLDITASASRAQLTRAKQLLRKMLEVKKKIRV